MRKQYHSRRSERGRLIWDVDRLVELSAGFEPVEVPLSSIRELDETFWFDGEGDRPTCRSVALHARLMTEVDLGYPIILSADGGVMDGMHRVCMAFMLGRETVTAVQFSEDPEPDCVDVSLDDLPYDED